MAEILPIRSLGMKVVAVSGVSREPRAAPKKAVLPSIMHVKVKS